MDVRIGVTYSARELEVRLPEDADPAAIKAEVERVLAGDGGVLWLTDRKGREVGVPAEKVAYVELGSSADSRPMGFSG